MKNSRERAPALKTTLVDEVPYRFGVGGLEYPEYFVAWVEVEDSFWLDFVLLHCCLYVLFEGFA